MNNKKQNFFSFSSIFLTTIKRLLCIRLSNHMNSFQIFVYGKIKYDGRIKTSPTNIKKTQKNHNNKHEILRIKLHINQIR